VALRTQEGPRSMTDTFSQSSDSLRNNINILTQDSVENDTVNSLAGSIERHEKQEE